MVPRKKSFRGFLEVGEYWIVRRVFGIINRVSRKGFPVAFCVDRDCAAWEV